MHAFVLPDGRAEFRLDHSGTNAVHADIGSGQLERDGFRQAEQSSLAHRVGANGRKCLIATDRRNVHYRTTASLLDVWHNGFRQEECGFHVDVKNLANVLMLMTSASATVFTSPYPTRLQVSARKFN